LKSRKERSEPSLLSTISLYATPREFTEESLRGSTSIVVDVLRSSSTIASALVSGAREIIPVMTPAEAGELATKAGRAATLLCGERDGKRIEGFDLGNSPLEYTTERVGGRTLIFASTNGSPVMVRARVSDRVLVGGFNNFSAVVESVIAAGKPVTILCSGLLEQFAIEDFVCGGKFVAALRKEMPDAVTLNDGAKAAVVLYQHLNGSLVQLLRESTHGQYLASLGFEEDLDFCAQVDSLPIVPTLVEGKIKGYRPDGTPFGEPAFAAA
jgi:2-phosphosulfolactate phosphatase